MRQVDKDLMQALRRCVADRVRTGKESMEHQRAVKEAFVKSITERLRPKLEEMRRVQKEQGLPHALDCWAKEAYDPSITERLAQENGQQNETWGDVGKLVGSGLAHAAASSVGIDTKKVGKVIRALRRKKPKVIVSKAPAKQKTKLKHSVSIEPVKIDRKTFAAKLKASGNRLDKTSLS